MAVILRGSGRIVQAEADCGSATLVETVDVVLAAARADDVIIATIAMRFIGAAVEGNVVFCERRCVRLGLVYTDAQCVRRTLAMVERGVEIDRTP